MALMRALELGLHESSLTGFYRLARSVCVKKLSDYDAFDQAFLSYFKDVYFEASKVSDELLSWLRNPAKLDGLSPAERALIESLDLEALRKLFEERLAEQKERHDGGSKWVGTRGRSPFGAFGTHPTGIRVGPVGAGRSAMQVASERRFRNYRKDRILDVRQIDVALRGLRRLGRDGVPDELDLDDTVDATCKNAGELELVFHPPKRNRLKLMLLMDVGGSMDPYTRLVERLFTAASRAGRFSRFRSFYFHNCVYEEVYQDAAFRKPIAVDELISTSDREERLVVVGDAFMHPAELLQAGGTLYYYRHNPTPGIEWLRRLTEHYRRSIWLNPEPEKYWPRTTIEIVASVFPMYPLTLGGLERAVRYLVRGGDRPIVGEGGFWSQAG